MRILVDSREQNCLDFPFEHVTGIVTQKLDVGDYACQFDNGTIAPVFFERKSKGDLFGTLGKGYKRFKKELQRAVNSDIRIIIIVECSLLLVLRGYSYKTRSGGTETSKIRGSAIAKTMFTLWVKYGVFPVFCKNREEMANYIYGTFYALEKQYKKGN